MPTRASGADSTKVRNRASLARSASSARWRSVRSRMMLVTSTPWSVSSALKVISAGNSLPSWRRAQSSAPAGFLPPEPPRPQPLDGLAQEFFAAVAEQLFRLGVGQHKAPGAIHRKDGVRSHFQEPAEFALADLEFGGAFPLFGR